MGKVSLVELAKLKFEDLSEHESAVLCAVEGGQEAIANTASSIRAMLLEWVCTDAEAIRSVHRHGVALRTHTISGLLDLTHADVRFPLQLRECAFDSDICIKGGRLRSFSFRRCFLQGLNADSAVIDTNLLIVEGCEVHGEVSLRGAVIEGDLRTDGSTFYGSKDFALVCDRVRVAGGVFLSRTSSIGRYQREVRFAGAVVSGNFDCEHAIFDNKGKTSINLERLRTSGSLFLRESTSSGVVNISASRIEVALDCRDAKMLADASRAFHAEKVSVGAHVLLDGDFRCASAHFLGATVEGGLRCRNGSIKKLDLRYAHIAAIFEWTEMCNSDGYLIDLRESTVGSIKDDVQNWTSSAQLLLDGLSFNRFTESVTDVKTRLRWLKLDATSPVQAYRQLSQVYQSNGHTRDATKVLFALEELVRSRDTSRLRQIWSWILKLTIGYGYQLWRSAILMISLWAIGTVVAALGYQTKLIAPTEKEANVLFISEHRVPTQYQRFSSPFFSIEHCLPGLNLGISVSWSANTTAEWPRHCWFGPVVRFWCWAQTLFGWFLSIFFLAGVSGIVKSSK